MKRAILLYNPKAGNRRIVNNIDFIIKKMQEFDFQLSLYRSAYTGSIQEYIINEITQSSIDLIMVSGGDGTINECINGVMKKNLDIPIMILPLGTANDFANTADIPSNLADILDIIKTGEIRYVDIGSVNNKYFINVCNMGVFSGVSHETDLQLKKNFGKLAYYVKGIEELQKYEAMHLEIEYDGKLIEEKYSLVLIFNGKGAGGFNKIAKDASIEDGYFDFIGIKEVDFIEIPKLFIKMLQGEHLEDDKVDYIKMTNATIRCLNNEVGFATDIDGEVGPPFPLNIQLIQNRIKVYLPKI
ncbi:MAG: lipid kinase [Epulopiscium sp. Nuni2H_MBin001]|nr:MAG: lipid kinase [Epulopiscium sp. Nuni2H_MBin001]